MRHDMGYAPRYSAEETVREYVAQTQSGGYEPDAVSLAQDEENLKEIIERRKHSRDQRESHHGNKLQEVG
jgi:hypothetical protein